MPPQEALQNKEETFDTSKPSHNSPKQDDSSPRSGDWLLQAGRSNLPSSGSDTGISNDQDTAPNASQALLPNRSFSNSSTSSGDTAPVALLTATMAPEAAQLQPSHCPPLLATTDACTSTEPSLVASSAGINSTSLQKKAVMMQQQRDMQKDVLIQQLQEKISRLTETMQQLVNQLPRASTATTSADMTKFVTQEQLQVAQLQEKLDREREKNLEMSMRMSSIERELSDLKSKVPAQGAPSTYSPSSPGPGLQLAHSPMHYPLAPPPWGTASAAGCGPRQPPVPPPLPSSGFSRPANSASHCTTNAPCTPKAAPLSGLGTPASVGSPSAGPNSAASARSGYTAASSSSNAVAAGAAAPSPIRKVAPELSLAASSPLGASNATRMQALHCKVADLVSSVGLPAQVCA